METGPLKSYLHFLVLLLASCVCATCLNRYFSLVSITLMMDLYLNYVWWDSPTTVHLGLVKNGSKQKLHQILLL